MANSLHTNIEGKVCVIKENKINPKYRDLKYRLFKVKGGFGAVDVTAGTSVVGVFLYDGEHCAWNAMTFERFATEEEIASIPPYQKCPKCKGSTFEQGEEQTNYEGKKYWPLLPCSLCNGKGGFAHDVELTVGA